MDNVELITKYFNDLTIVQINQLAQLKDLYVDWNAKINVISRKDMDNFYLHHVLHSLAIAKFFHFTPGYQVMDLGSGGGFPGIPLAIMFPNVQFYLADSIKKKMKVAAEVAAAIGLGNVTTHHIRAEDIRDQKFEVVMSRAVAPLGQLWEWSKPLIKPILNKESVNGLICLKGGDLLQEISDSRSRPSVHSLRTVFEEEFFIEKVILHVPKVA